MHIPRAIREPAPGSHTCQFHQHPKTLTRVVSAFIDAGLARGDGIVVVAVAERRAALLERLAEQGARPAAAIDAGQFVMLDAEELLQQFMVDGVPQPQLFRDTVEPVLDGVEARGFRRVRIYGEMVNVLWQQGDSTAALRLEELWNDLATVRPFALFCGYECDNFDPKTYLMPLDEVVRAHTDVVANDDDDRVQAAVDVATSSLLGLPLSSALTYFGKEGSESEHKLPPGQRTLLWLQRNIPSAFGQVLGRARNHYKA